MINEINTLRQLIIQLEVKDINNTTVEELFNQLLINIELVEGTFTYSLLKKFDIELNKIIKLKKYKLYGSYYTKINNFNNVGGYPYNLLFSSNEFITLFSKYNLQRNKTLFKEYVLNLSKKEPLLLLFIIYKNFFKKRLHYIKDLPTNNCPFLFFNMKNNNVVVPNYLFFIINENIEIQQNLSNEFYYLLEDKNLLSFLFKNSNDIKTFKDDFINYVIKTKMKKGKYLFLFKEGDDESNEKLMIHFLSLK